MELSMDEDAAYAGCSVNIVKRMKQHRRENRKIEPIKNLVYSHLREQELTCKERIPALLAFPLAKRMHLELVEGIFTIWLDTLNKPEKDYRIVALANSKLARSIRKGPNRAEVNNLAYPPRSTS
ncbi:hypothetical protein N7474_009876 [Penicillium riverlandense]|uniref:uncharacterized protein n=1 Tax=Penicillium riverlandense TaxID=1903569 RepID=UPI002547F478|nr:uncharacterized protein N7474_009876 [Penicillium riverlandense]KAJ5808607.1 hypothetical protein N7474_009876 [Penicillium riverlandense]